MPQYLKLLTKQITVLCAFIVALLLLCGCVPCLAQGAPVEIDYQTLWHDHMVVVGQPELVVEEEDFVVSYNATNLQPNWVAWRLTASRAMADGYTFEGRFASDPQVPSRFKQAKDNDYRNSASPKATSLTGGTTPTTPYSGNSVSSCRFHFCVFRPCLSVRDRQGFFRGTGNPIWR